MNNQDQWGVGKNADAKAFDKTKLGENEVELIFGEHPHARNDNTIYARAGDGTIYDFDGHRRLIDIEIKSKNYLKESGLSGDEIRKEVTGKIFVDGIQVYEVSGREVASTLLRIHHLIIKIGEHSSHWFSAEERKNMIGRKIWYHDQPATIIRTIDDQGAIIIATEPGFKPPRSSEDPDEYDYWDDWKEGDHYEVKDDVLSPHIWWWRD